MLSIRNQCKMYISQCTDLTITIKATECKEIYDVKCGLCSEMIEKLEEIFGQHFIDQNNDYNDAAFEGMKPCWINMSKSDEQVDKYKRMERGKKKNDDPLADAEEYVDYEPLFEVKQEAEQLLSENKEFGEKDENGDGEEKEVLECSSAKSNLQEYGKFVKTAKNKSKAKPGKSTAKKNDDPLAHAEDYVVEVKEEADQILSDEKETKEIREKNEDDVGEDDDYLPSENEEIESSDEDDAESNRQEYDKFEKTAKNKSKAKPGKPAIKRKAKKISIDGLDLEEEMKKKRIKSAVKALSKDNSSLPLSQLTHEQHLQLMKMYENAPCLWHVDSIDFFSKTLRQKALDNILQMMKTQMDMSYSKEELEKLLLFINDACKYEKRRRLECERLQLEYKPTCKYYNEIAFLEPNIAPFRCELCNDIVVFYGPDKYRIHKSTHDGSNPFTCSICNRDLVDAPNYREHMRRHTGDYAFKCELCSKSFITTAERKLHMRSHTGEKPFFCEICGKSYGARASFTKHRNRHLNIANYKCSMCSKSFYDNIRLRDHIKGHLNVRDKVCNVCGKAFTRTKNLSQHKQIHAEKKKYLCNICHREFAQAAGLCGHMKSHNITKSLT